MFFEDAIGCTIDQAYQDMVATKKRFHKTDKVQGFHLVQSFAEGEVSPELAHLIRILGGEDALNLDGGGSTTLWLSGASDDGVVNYPCDNGRFDHAGERKVPNILYIH